MEEVVTFPGLGLVGSFGEMQKLLSAMTLWGKEEPTMCVNWLRKRSCSVIRKVIQPVQHLKPNKSVKPITDLRNARLYCLVFQAYRRLVCQLGFVSLLLRFYLFQRPSQTLPTIQG